MPTISSYYYDPQLRRQIESLLLPEIQMPGQYIGGEQGCVVKRAEEVRGRLCFAFPDTYTIGMSHYGLQLLYAIMNRQENWACERAFTPERDMENLLLRNQLPLYSLETFTPLDRFDVLAFSLQYELCFTNVLTMLSLGRIPIHSEERTMSHPLVIAGGPSVMNPEPMSPFIDLFVIGDGEESLPAVCNAWLEYKNAGTDRKTALLEMARRFPYVYVPRFYHVEMTAAGRAMRPRPLESGVPEFVRPAVIPDLNRFEPPTFPVLPLIESVHDRISIEIMRGCPGQCRFCQSTVQKSPIRTRTIDSIVESAKTACEKTGVRDVSLLSLSASDYPGFDELVQKLREKLTSLGISIAVPSLRVNHQLSEVMQSLTPERSSGITIAPEAARDEMRKRILKQVTNANLLDGCRSAFENGFSRVKLYFMCGLPLETGEDIDGIVELSEKIAFLGKSVTKHFPVVTASVSNFIPKPQTPFQWLGMQSREYFAEVHQKLRTAKHLKCVQVKYHGLETSLLEGLLCRGDRRMGHVIEKAWRNGARLDAWREHFRFDLWQNAVAETGINENQTLHEPYSLSEELPWGHIQTCRPVLFPRFLQSDSP
ncbi:MAG: TIGR03960 family B12-binding radical SAM protein [Planctomycetaceae bacterium]|jgi:radical SAM family uncharacterized protein|nr:TIGR03960 family B12-binding radical SAM protein [Planctomycetaceae bacterium]